MPKKILCDAGLLGKVSHVEMCCYYHMRCQWESSYNRRLPDIWIIEIVGPGARTMAPYDGLPHRRCGGLMELWNELWAIFAITYVRYSFGGLLELCIGPKELSSTGGNLCKKKMVNPILR